MAQGKLKAKIQLPKGAKQKGGHQKKHLGPKKGGGYIAPKKAKIIEAKKIQKALSKEINQHIEQDTRAKAGKFEPKTFHVVKSGDGKPSTSSQ